MSNTIKLKRSTTANSKPTIAQLEPGELAINTNDGRVYFERDSTAVKVFELPSTAAFPYFTNHNYYTTSTSRLFVPINSTSTSTNIADHQVGMVLPYAAVLKNVIVTSGIAGGSTRLKVFKNKSTATALADVTVNMTTSNTTYTFDTSAAIFQAGDSAHLELDFTNGPKDVQLTCIYNLDFGGTV